MPRPLYRLAIPLALSLLAGCQLLAPPPASGPDDREPGEPAPACEAHADCRGGELCVDGDCREACSTREDCDGADTPACDGETGLCVECTLQSDCEEGFTCNADNACARACVTDDDCLLDAFFCDASGACVARECQEDGDCDGGELCRASLCVPVDDPDPPEEPVICAPNVIGCVDDDTVSICSGDGTSEQRIDCNADQVCQGGICRNLICEAGASSCQGDNLLRCNESGTDATVVACDNTPACAFEDNGCTCDLDACVPRVCAPGARECVANGFRACRADGLGFTEVEACDEICVAGSCVSSTCAPGDTLCSGATLLTCNALGTGFSATDCAAGGQTCVDDGSAACEAERCEPLAVRCQGDSVARCDAFGLEETLTPCGADQRCEAGACVNETPVSDAGLVVQLLWSASDGDLDLHLSRSADDELCTLDSCHYANCKPGTGDIFNPTNNNRPDWDGSGGLSSGDPLLELDDLDGNGPEVISIDTPVAGTYRARVHVFQPPSAPTVATIRVLSGGVLVGEHQQVLNADQQLWDGVDIVVGGAVSSADTGVVLGGADCGFDPNGGENPPPPPPGDSCVTNRDCAADEICGGGLSCTPGCRANSDCGFPTPFCAGDGSCQLFTGGFGDSCTTSADCGAGLYCDLLLTQTCVETCDPTIVDCAADASCCPQSGADTCVDIGVQFFVRPTCFALGGGAP